MTARTRPTLRSLARDAAWIAGAIAVYLLLFIVVLPRLGFST